MTSYYLLYIGLLYISWPLRFIVYFVFSYFLPRTSILVLYQDTRTYMCYSFLKSLHMCVVLLYVLMSSFTLTFNEWCGDLWNIFATLLYFLFDDIDIRCTLSIPLVILFFFYFFFQLWVRTFLLSLWTEYVVFVIHCFEIFQLMGVRP